jgi:CDP-4-dehydro-6-deoxyglucose reductase, E1
MISLPLKKQVVSEYKKRFGKKKFIPGVTPVPVSGKVFDEKELMSGVESILDGWWTEGRFAKEFEGEFKKFLGVNYVSLVNSGSSANLLALAALTSTSLGKRALQPGDEVITAATGFPTTINPIIQNRMTAVLVDNDVVTKNARASDIKKAITKKTRAIMMAHMLGNPFELDEIMRLAKRHDLWLIEDCCDALGSTYPPIGEAGKGKLVGTFGDVATFSFYPAHQITMGEGGAIVTNNPLIHRAIRQFRDWGRDCWCDTGCDNTCGKRFSWKMGDLPYGYDHKYIYSQIGYNLKLTDMQAAIGLAQLKKLPTFIKKRKENFNFLYQHINMLTRWYILPEKTKGSDPCWFGFPIVVKKDAPFTKLELLTYLEKKKIATRELFAGNITKHPAYLKRKDIRVVGALSNSNFLMNNGFWIGVYPGLTGDMISYVKEAFLSFPKRST